MEANGFGGGGPPLRAPAAWAGLTSQHHGRGAVERGSCRAIAVMLAVKSIVIDQMSIARAAALLGVAWNTASDAILAAGTELVDNADRLEGVTTIGIDEHTWRGTRAGDKIRYGHH